MAGNQIVFDSQVGSNKRCIETIAEVAWTDIHLGEGWGGLPDWSEIFQYLDSNQEFGSYIREKISQFVCSVLHRAFKIGIKGLQDQK